MPSKKLTEICSPKQYKTITQKELKPEGYPVYGANGIIGYYDTYNHENPTLLIGCRGTCGVLQITLPKSYTNGNAMALDDIEGDIDQKYLYYYLKNRGLEDIITGTSQPQITGQSLEKVVIEYPPLTKQQSIVSILDKADEIRAKKRLANEKLDEFLKSTFISMFGDPKTNTNNYEFVTINDLTTEISDIGSNGSNAVVASNLVMSDTEDYAYMIRTLNFNDTNIMNNMKYVSKKVYDFFKKSQIFGNEIIMCKIGSAGKFWIMPKLDKPVSLGLNQFFMRFNDKVLREFVYYFLCTGFGQNEIDNRISGAVTKSITKGAIRTIPIYLPPMDEQNKFAKIVEHVEAQKQKNELVIEQMNNLFNSLSQRAFKGGL